MADDIMKKVKMMTPIWTRLHNAAKLTKHHRQKIPTKIRLELYNKIVVTAFEKYNQALIREYKKVI